MSDVAVSEFESQWNIVQAFGFLVANSLEVCGIEVHRVEPETKLIDLVFSVPSPNVTLTTTVYTVVNYDPDSFVVDSVKDSVVSRLLIWLEPRDNVTDTGSP